jgi:glycosyltransferase involved in cell wall biosynthesis
MEPRGSVAIADPGTAVPPPEGRLRILTWHVHGSYLLSLAHVPHDFYLPVAPGRPAGYQGRTGPFPWPPNVHEVDVRDVPRTRFDCVLYQSRRHYTEDRFRVLSPAQRRLPRIYLEHDPPREHPTDQRHVVDDPDALLVHVTPFNALMWDAGRTPVRVIEHGVPSPGVRCTGELPRGIVVVNDLPSRGRRVGADLFLRFREHVPLDLIGMGSEAVGGLGEVPHDRLPRFIARYRFLCNPIRYTSLGLAVIEAMLVGLPVVGLATTEMATAVRDGVGGYADTDPGALVERMRELLADPARARRLGEGARRIAETRFSIRRFVDDWLDAFATVTGRRTPAGRLGAARR